MNNKEKENIIFLREIIYYQSKKLELKNAEMDTALKVISFLIIIGAFFSPYDYVGVFAAFVFAWLLYEEWQTKRTLGRDTERLLNHIKYNYELEHPEVLAIEMSTYIDFEDVIENGKEATFLQKYK